MLDYKSKAQNDAVKEGMLADNSQKFMHLFGVKSYQETKGTDKEVEKYYSDFY